MPKIKGSPEKGTRSEGKQRVYAGAYSSNYLQAKGDVFADLPNPMGEGAKLWSSSKNTGPGYDPAMSYYNPAETAADHRAGKTGKNTLVPHSQEFELDTVAPRGSVSPQYHKSGGFPAPVSTSSNHPRYRKQAKPK